MNIIVLKKKTLKLNLRSLVQLVSAIDLKSNQLIDFLKVIGSI